MEEIQKELDVLRPLLTPRYYGTKRCHRLGLDEHYNNHIDRSCILNHVKLLLYSDKLKAELTKIEDMSYQKMFMPHSFTTTFTELRTEQSNEWHNDTDMLPGTFMAWIIYMNDDFEGGDLIVRFHGEELVIKPERNKLVLMPAYFEHMITEVKYPKGSNYRATIHGVMY